MVLKDCLRKICSISKKNNSIILFDCKDKEVYSIKGEKIYYSHSGIIQEFSIEERKTIKYFYTINNEFRNTYNIKKVYDLATVLILVGRKDGKEKILQVGRNKSFKNMLNGDINFDARYIIQGSDNKYSKLNYDTLSFYQVDIDSYLEGDEHIFEILNGEVPQNEVLKAAYYNIKAAYVEGKLAALENADLWNPSGGIDGYIYQHFQKHLKLR